MTDENQLISIEAPFPEETPAAPAPEAQISAQEDDAEPEGTVEVAPGRRMVDVSVVAAERKRARELAEKKVREAEVEPLKAKAQEADALREALDAVKPHLEQLRAQAQQQPPQRPSQPEIQVSRDEAEQEARDLQLYDKNGNLDVQTGGKVVYRRRLDALTAARAAAHEAVLPYAQNQAQFAAKNQLSAAMQELKAIGADAIVSEQDVLQQFRALGDELAQNPEVAAVARQRALGMAVENALRRRAKAPQAPAREPVLSEAPGGRIQPDVSVSETGRKMGLTKDDMKDSAKTFTPGGLSPIGSW